jgi:N-acetylglucosaminyl-diphospho-decaprenol L-rhamnosyltransferase
MGPVDTVLVAFNSEDVIERALHPLRPLGGRVVVVDHGDGASAQKAAELGAITFEDPTNPGFGTGQNRGFESTGTDFVLLCNPDAIVSPDAVLQGVQVMAAHPDVAAVQGVIVNTATGSPERSQGLELRAVHLLGRAVDARRLLRRPAIRSIARRCTTLGDHVERVPAGPVEVESLAATAVLVRRTAFAEVGGFDPSFFLYGEDFDLCHRLRLAGWKLLALPGVWAEHLGGASMSSTWDREIHWWRGNLTFAARWWGRSAWALALVAATIRCVRLAAGDPKRSYEAVSALVITPARSRRRAGRAAGILALEAS